MLALLARRACCFGAGSNHNSAGTSIIYYGTDTIDNNAIGINTICVYDGIVTIYIYDSAITVNVCDGSFTIYEFGNSPANPDSLGRSG